MTKGWYETTNVWKSFNDFFTRRLISPDVRPIADSVLVSPADSTPQGVWEIDSLGFVQQTLSIKSAEVGSVMALIGYDSKYCFQFADGCLTHTFLDVNDYHRFHFPVSGTTRILDAETNTLIPVNVNGKAKMVTRKDGTVLTKFEPQYPVVKQNRQIVDLLSVRKIGNLELDFFDRDPKGHVKKDVYGNPVINQAGRDLIKYGVAFGPVDGFIHKRVYDPKMHEFRDSVTPDKYQVTLVNGGLCPTRMKKVMELDQNGNQIMTVSRTGEDVPKYHYECADAKVSGGKVRIGNQELEPATPKDLDSYKRGRGGVFKGCEYTDLKTKKRVVYDVFAVPDNQRGGFAKGFRPSVSEELIKRQQDAKKTVSKKQNFSMGF